MRPALFACAAALLTACGGAPRKAMMGERPPTPFADVPIVFGDPVPASYFERYAVNPTVETLAEPTSTVALDPDTSSFDDARRALLAGHVPAPASVRTEAFVNHAARLAPPLAPLPSADALIGPVSATAQAFPSPTRPGYHLLHIAVTASAEAPPASDVVVVVDLHAARAGLCSAAEHLLPPTARRWSLLGFGPRVEVLAPPSADRAFVLLQLRRLAGCDSGRAPPVIPPVANGAWSKALETAMALARRGVPGARSQVVAWLGAAPEARAPRARDVDLVLVRAGAPRVGASYASDVSALARGLGGRALDPPTVAIAPLAVVDVVAQVHFDPARVARYRLLGYEGARHDGRPRRPGRYGGRLAAGESASLLYEVKLNPGERALARLDVRARPPGAPSHSVRVTVPSDRVYSTADPLVAIAAAFAEHLRRSYWTRHITCDTLRAHHRALPAELRADPAVAGLGDLIERAAAHAPTRAVAAPADFDHVPIVRR